MQAFANVRVARHEACVGHANGQRDEAQAHEPQKNGMLPNLIKAFFKTASHIATRPGNSARVLNSVDRPPDPQIARGKNIVDAGDTDEWSRDQDTGDRRADNTNQIHPGGVERDRVGEMISLTDDLWFE